MSEKDTPEQVHMVRAALAEAGWPNAKVTYDGMVWVTLAPQGVPNEVCWMAFYICDMALICWPCWRDNVDECTHEIGWSIPKLPRLGSAPLIVSEK